MSPFCVLYVHLQGLSLQVQDISYGSGYSQQNGCNCSFNGGAKHDGANLHNARV